VERILQDCPEAIEQKILGSPYSVKKAPSLIEKHWFVPLVLQQRAYLSGGNLFIHKMNFVKVGGFDERLVTGEDFEFCHRARLHGVSVQMDSSLSVVHLGFPTSISQFVKRELWHGMGDFSSLSVFIRSRIAVASVAFTVFLLSGLVALLFQFYWVAVFFFVASVAISMLFVAYKFRLKSLKSAPVQLCLASAYLFARGTSWIKYFY
jgi:GT2 family glycosyltransferase